MNSSGWPPHDSVYVERGWGPGPMLTVPWRQTMNPTTGLPAVTPIYLEKPLAEGSEQMVDCFLRTQAPTLWPSLGRKISSATNRIKVSTWNRTESSTLIPLDCRHRHPRIPNGPLPRGSVYKMCALFSFATMFWHQRFRNLPVIGGGVRVHGRIDEPLVTITSSYSPVDDDQIIGPGSAEAVALDIARAAVVTHVLLGWASVPPAANADPRLGVKTFELLTRFKNG